MDDLLNNLNPEQKQAVAYGCGPFLIVAGAGTGKTTVITRRIAWLIRQGLARPEEILALTFTEKAAGEMAERVDRLLPYGYFELWVSTFHAFAERILRNQAIDVGLANNFKLMNSTDAWMLVRQNLAKFNLDYYRPLGNPTKFIHALLKHFSRAKDECISPEDYLNYVQNLKLDREELEFRPKSRIEPRRQSERLGAEEADRLGEVANAYHLYQNLLLAENAFDFGDLINYTLELFRKRPSILQKYQEQFKYILVDEFQDTNLAQYELIKLLAGAKNNLTVVGDDDQAIYRFRGASMSNILMFKKDFPDAREIFLTQNYRSKQNLLDFSYKFIQLNNPNRLEYQLDNESRIKNQELRIKVFSKRLVSQSQDAGTIEHIRAKTHFDEAKAVVDKILEIYNQGRTSAAGRTRDSARDEINWNDFAILVRANDHADLFIRELADRGLPYQFLASRGLYSKPIILDILACLRLLDNYHESTAFYRLLNLPFWNLSEAARIELLHYASRKTISLYTALKQAAAVGLHESDVRETQKILGLIEKHRQEARQWKVGRIIYAFLSESGYLEWLTQKEDKHRLDSLQYLNYFWKKIQEFEAREVEPSVKNFIKLVDLELESGEEGALPALADEGPEAVKILTIHAAKGLEFRYVFMVNLVDQRFPTRERHEAIELPNALVKEIVPEGDVHLQEERRLFYVACTRAKEGLFLTSALDYGGARPRKPSRFLYELGIIDENFKFQISNFKNTNNHLVYKDVKQPEATAVISKLELPSKFSFTQIKAFETCPLQYKFAHLLKIPVRSRATFSFGKSIHQTLHKFFIAYKDRAAAQQASLFSSPKETIVNNQPLSFARGRESRIMDLMRVEELFKAYEDSFIDDWYDSQEQKAAYYNNGKRVLKSFYEATSGSAPEILSLEAAFNFKIGQTTFKGVIDRVDKLPDGTLELIDYKTGVSKDLEKVDKDQLLIYQLASREFWCEPVSKLTYWYVEDGKKVSFLGAPEELEALGAKLEKTIGELRASTYPATPSEFKCKFCDFKDICEFRII